MKDAPNDSNSLEDDPRRGLSMVASLGAAVGAVALAFFLYGLTGFPHNIPLAMGAAVLIAEVVESAIHFGGAAFRGRRAGRMLIHAVAVAGAAWLGVWVAALVGWMG